MPWHIGNCLLGTNIRSVTSTFKLHFFTSRVLFLFVLIHASTLHRVKRLPGSFRSKIFKYCMGSSSNGFRKSNVLKEGVGRSRRVSICSQCRRSVVLLFETDSLVVLTSKKAHTIAFQVSSDASCTSTVHFESQIWGKHWHLYSMKSLRFSVPSSI